LVDDVADGVEAAYTGWPDRLYVIARDGQVVYKSAPGPFGFEPDAMEQSLRQTLADANPHE
jgi:Iodothyronine deiodinase